MSPSQVTLHLQGRKPIADFQVSDQAGQRVWSHLQGQTLLGVLRLYPLDAGKSLTFKAAWDQTSDSGGLVPPGEYLIRGVVLTDEAEGLASPPSRLTIE